MSSTLLWNHMRVNRNKEKCVVFTIGGPLTMVTSYNDIVSVKEKGRNNKHIHCQYWYPPPDLRENLPAAL